MKRFVLGLLMTSISAVATLQACGYGSCNSYDPCCDPCPEWCCGSFEVGAQAIYLRPTSCDFGFVIADDRPYNPNGSSINNQNANNAKLPQGHHKGIDPDYEWGFRVSLGYVFDCLCYDVRLEYTYLHTHDKSDVFAPENGSLWPTYAHPRYMGFAQTTGEDPQTFAQTPIFSFEGNPAHAHSRVKFDYDAVDLQFGSRSRKGCNLWLRGYAGLHFANIDCGFGIGAHFAAAILAGETDGKMVQHHVRAWDAPNAPVNVDETLDVPHKSRNVLFPYFKTSLGINYLWCCGDCFNLVAEVGYEFSTYINVLNQFRFNDSRGTGAASCNSFNLDGLYISLRVTI